MREQLLATRLFSVEKRVYPDPAGGQEVARDVVVHPGAVVVLPVLDDARVVMIRNYRYTVEQHLLELPAGTREDGESAISCAARELAEETGYEAGTIEPLGEFFTSPGILTERMHAFMATDLRHVGQRLEPSERITVETYAPGLLKSMLGNGELRDGKTIAVLGMYFLGRRESSLPATEPGEPSGPS